MFYNEYPAADTTVAAIVTLLATAKAVWKMKEVIQQESDTDIIFAFLQGVRMVCLLFGVILFVFFLWVVYLSFFRGHAVCLLSGASYGLSSFCELYIYLLSLIMQFLFFQGLYG